MIPAETVEQIHQTAVIEDVIGDYVELKKQGSSFRGIEPISLTRRRLPFTLSRAREFSSVLALERVGP